MRLADIKRHGGSLDDGEHAIAHTPQQHKHQHHFALPARQQRCSQQHQQAQGQQQQNEPVGAVHIQVMLKKIHQQAARYLDHTNACRQCNRPGLAHALLTQQAHHVRRHGHRDRHHQRQKNPDQHKPEAAHMLPQRVTVPVTQRAGPAGARGRAQCQCMHRQTNQQVQGSEHLHRCAPTPVGHEPSDQGNEHRAGQATQKGHGDDGASKIARVAPRHHRKHRRVQHGRHGSTQSRPGQIQAKQPLRQAEQQQAQCGQQ